MSQNRQDYFSKANLKERGWTDTAIVKFLGEEDKKAANSHNRYSPVCLYIKSRVITIEGTPEFKTWREKSQKRSESAKKGAQTRLLREAQAEQLRIEQLRDLNAKVNACVLGIQPLAHKELIQIVVNRWNEQNPSPQRFQPKTTKLSAEIKRLSNPSQQKITALMNNANGVLTRHFDRVQKNANPNEFTKSINDLFASIRGFINFFNKEERLAQLIVVDLEVAEAIANNKNLETMLNWLSEIIDLIEDDPEITVGAERGIDLITLVTEQVLFQHREPLNKFQTYLVEIAAQFPLVSNRHEIANRKFLNELIQLYPALSQAFVKTISVDKLNWQQQEKEVLAFVGAL